MAARRDTLEARFAKYTDRLAEALAHADRRTPFGWYLKGLMLPGTRKSVEPMAARVQPHNVRSAHQSMHHLVADADWNDTALLAQVAQEVLPALRADKQTPCFWILDDTGSRKYGKHSVGVARQYCGQLGKTENCQVAVSLSFATLEGSLPLAWQLYLPQEWTEDRRRCLDAGVPKDIAFATKGEIAHQQIEAALNAGIARGSVLMDAGYGDEAALRDWLTAKGLTYAVGIRPATAVWWGSHQPAPTPAKPRLGRPRTRVKRDARHTPIGVRELALKLPQKHYRTVTWREGTNSPLSSRFARLRVRAAQGDKPRPEEWLVIEWPHGEAEPTRYFLSTLAPIMSFKALVATIKMRWRIERDYQELKQELGLGSYEGRNWRGFHHHASLCIAAYGFLMLERLRGVKKNATRFKAPALPKSFRPRGALPHAAPRTVVHRHRALLSGTSHCAPSRAVPVLRESVRTGHS